MPAEDAQPEEARKTAEELAAAAEELERRAADLQKQAEKLKHSGPLDRRQGPRRKAEASKDEAIPKGETPASGVEKDPAVRAAEANPAPTPEMLEHDPGASKEFGGEQQEMKERAQEEEDHPSAAAATKAVDRTMEAATDAMETVAGSPPARAVKKGYDGAKRHGCLITTIVVLAVLALAFWGARKLRGLPEEAAPTPPSIPLATEIPPMTPIPTMPAPLAAPLPPATLDPASLPFDSLAGRRRYTPPTDPLLPAEGSLPFTDVPPTHPTYAAVGALYRAGIIDGHESGRFQPDAAITRAEVAKMLVLATRTESQPPGVQYGDLTPTDGVSADIYADFVPAIYTAVAEGWMAPIASDRFGPWYAATRDVATYAIFAATGRGSPTSDHGAIARGEFCILLAKALES